MILLFWLGGISSTIPTLELISHVLTVTERLGWTSYILIITEWSGWTSSIPSHIPFADVYISPKKQMESAVLPKDIQCRDDLILTIRDNDKMACVKETTFWKLGPCSDYGTESYPYQSVIPINYSISSGKFVNLCANPDYLFYIINLDTTTSGNLTIEIPKDTLDLKQFDYESCNPDELSTNIQSNDIVTVQQISQTEKSRILEFSWSEPISHIEYFGVYAVGDDTDWSEPNHCIDLSYSKQKRAETEKIDYYLKINKKEYTRYTPIHIAHIETGYGNHDFDMDIFDRHYCAKSSDKIVYLNHTISNGYLRKICSIDYSTLFLNIESVTENAILILDVPQKVFHPKNTFAARAAAGEDPGRNIKTIGTDYIYTPSPDTIKDFLKRDHSNPELIRDYYHFLHSTEKNIRSQITQIGSYDTFVRYHIPIGYSDKIITMHDFSPELHQNVKYEPQKYACKSNYTSIMRSDNAKPVCVKLETAEELIQRGWMLFKYDSSQYIEPILKMEKSLNVMDKDESFIDVKLDPILYSCDSISSNRIKTNTIKTNDTNISFIPARIFPACSERILSQLPRVGDVINATFVVTSLSSQSPISFYPTFYIRDGLEFVNIPDDFELTYREPVRNGFEYYPGEYTLKGPLTSFEYNVTKSFTVQIRAISEGVNFVDGNVIDSSAVMWFVIGPTETLPREDYYAKYPDEKPKDVRIKLPTTLEEQLIFEEKYDVPFGTTTIRDLSEDEFIVWLKEYVQSLSKHDQDSIDRLAVWLKENDWTSSIPSHRPASIIYTDKSEYYLGEIIHISGITLQTSKNLCDLYTNAYFYFEGKRLDGYTDIDCVVYAGILPPLRMHHTTWDQIHYTYETYSFEQVKPGTYDIGYMGNTVSIEILNATRP